MKRMLRPRGHSLARSRRGARIPGLTAAEKSLPPLAVAIIDPTGELRLGYGWVTSNPSSSSRTRSASAPAASLPLPLRA